MSLRVILRLHPITQESFAIIDREVGDHEFTTDEYAIARRVIHSTADFEFVQLLHFSGQAIEQAILALQQGTMIVTDVGMVAQGICSMVKRTFQNPIVSAVNEVQASLPGCTLTETGILKCFEAYPQAIYVVGNAPTALLALCRQIQQRHTLVDSFGSIPPLVIGVPVGFVSVMEAKQALAQTPVPQIRVEGRKGGSAVAAGIVNALLQLAWDRRHGLDTSE